MAVIHLRKPNMILFDFGETLTTETFDPVKGNQALLEKAAKNPHHVSAEAVQERAVKLSQMISAQNSGENPIEVPTFQFQKYLFDDLDIEFTQSPQELEQIFISGSIDSKPTQGIDKFLHFLDRQSIRTAVISNISFSGDALKRWIQKDLPFHKFEFVVASSDYIFRKPSRYLFDIALKKAKLSAGDCWYCGNNFLFDVTGSFQAGLQPVWYKGAKWEDNRNGETPAYIEVADWDALEAVIARLT